MIVEAEAMVPGERVTRADLVRWVHGLCGPRAVIEGNTELYRDLGLSGDDAYELLVTIRGELGVDFAGFEFGRFFPDETDAMIYLWGHRIGLWRNRFQPLTVSHLEAVIERRQWFEPPQK